MSSIPASHQKGTDIVHGADDAGEAQEHYAVFRGGVFRQCPEQPHGQPHAEHGKPLSRSRELSDPGHQICKKEHPQHQRRQQAPPAARAGQQRQCNRIAEGQRAGPAAFDAAGLQQLPDRAAAQQHGRHLRHSRQGKAGQQPKGQHRQNDAGQCSLDQWDPSSFSPVSLGINHRRSLRMENRPMADASSAPSISTIISFMVSVRAA